MVLDVIHPARPNVSKTELSEKLGQMYKAPKEQVIVFGLRTAFGGGRSTGFALIYDSKDSMKFEPKHRLIRVSILPSCYMESHSMSSSGTSDTDHHSIIPILLYRSAWPPRPRRLRESSGRSARTARRRSAVPRRSRLARPARRSKRLLSLPIIPPPRPSFYHALSFHDTTSRQPKKSLLDLYPAQHVYFLHSAVVSTSLCSLGKPKLSHSPSNSNDSAWAL